MCMLDCLLVSAIIFYMYKAKIWMGVVTSLHAVIPACHPDGRQGCFADCGCEMPRRPRPFNVSSIEGPCLTTVQLIWDTDCPINSHFSWYGMVVIEENTFYQSAEGRWSSFNAVLDFAVQAEVDTQPRYVHLKGYRHGLRRREQADR